MWRRLSIAMLLTLLGGCGDDQPVAESPAAPMARPESTGPITAPAPEPEQVETDVRDAVREAVARELDELERRHRELTQTAADQPERSAAASNLLVDVGATLVEIRQELGGLSSASPEEIISLQARLTARLGDVTTMLEDAAALLELARSAPVALPELGDVPPPESRPGAPK